MGTEWLIVVAAAVGGLAGSLGALVTTLITTRHARLLSREERLDNHCRDAYLELTKTITSTLLPLAKYFDGNAPMPPVTVTADELQLVRGYALFGSDPARLLYYDVVAKYRAYAVGKGTSAQMRVLFNHVQTAARLLEEQIHTEMWKPPKTKWWRSLPWQRHDAN